MWVFSLHWRNETWFFELFDKNETMAILDQTRSASCPQPCLSDSGLWMLRERTRCYTAIFSYIFSILCQSVAWKLLGQEVASVLHPPHSPWGTFPLLTFTRIFEYLLFQPFINLQEELALILEEPRSKEKRVRTLGF